jgi:hypothetical protein
LGGAIALCACAPPPYRMPTANQAHAIVKIRRSYEVTAGITLRERAWIDEHVGFSDERHSELALAAVTDAILVHPRPATFVVESEFSHIESRPSEETYEEQELYTDSESYPCDGAPGEPVHECTRPVTRFGSAARTRWVTRDEEVSDGSCSRMIRFAPARDHTYLLQYTYQDNGACALSCFEQHPRQGTADFEQTLCPASPAPKGEHAHKPQWLCTGAAQVCHS